MKKSILILFALFLAIVMFSCTESDEQVLSPDEQLSSDVGVITGVEAEPYISEEMKSILAMLDTCTGPIAIDKLIPGYESLTLSASDSADRLTTKSTTVSQDGIYTIVTGYSNYSTLYTNVETTIDATQSANFGFEAGTYYVTCQAVSATVSTGGYAVFPEVFPEDIMGVNPDDNIQRGYHVTTISEYSYYQFTTYIWGIAYIDGGFILACVPNTPRQIVNPGDFRKWLNWRYLPYT